MNPWNSENGKQQQFITREQFEQIQAQHQQQLQHEQEQLEIQQQHIQQQQLEHQQMQQQHQQQLQQNHQQTLPSAFESALAAMAEGQRNLAESMSRLLIRLETPTQSNPKAEVPLRSIDKQHDKQLPPHLSTSKIPTRERGPYAPSSPSEGAYAADPSRRFLIQKEPKIRESLEFTGEARLLRQFLLDIYDILEQYSSEFANDKRKINWIAGHFVSNTNDVSPAQAWFLALLMKNAHAHGVTDPYANLKALDYVLPELSSTDAFIKELILIFGDKTSSRTAREDLAKCKQGSSSIVDYNSRYTALALYVVQSDEDAVIKYVAGLNPEVQYAAIHVAGKVQGLKTNTSKTLSLQYETIINQNILSQLIWSTYF